MPSLTAPITPLGPLIQVLLGVSTPRLKALKDAGEPVPNIVPATALVDTGASGTVIDPTVATALGLVQTGSCPMITPSTGSTPVTCATYDIHLAIYTVLPGNVQGLFHDFCMPVTAVSLAHQGFEVILGRDVLAKSLIVYHGAANAIILSF